MSVATFAYIVLTIIAGLAILAIFAAGILTGHGQRDEEVRQLKDERDNLWDELREREMEQQDEEEQQIDIEDPTISDRDTMETAKVRGMNYADKHRHNDPVWS